MRNLIGELKKYGIMIAAIQKKMCFLVKITQPVLVGVLEQGTFWYWILHTEEAKTIYNEV
jgi:hypothetical protein